MTQKFSGVLCLTNPSDFHSFVVSDALRRKGAEVWEWYTSDFPSLQTASYSLNGVGNEWGLLGPELNLSGITPRTVWMRGPSPPVLPSSVAKADRPFAGRESKAFLNCLLQEIGNESFWVNSVAGATRAGLKTEQLKAARRAGLQIPNTLCSNDPGVVRRFIRDSKSPVIYKAFYPVSWETADGAAVLFSSHVKEPDLPDDVILQAVPGIYQEQVQKKYELRITAMGETLVAAKIDSQAVHSARLDWRSAKEPVPMEQIEISSALADACRAIMTDLGIVFGCFDLIVTPEGETVFLEVNEAGAFLWIEEQNPEFGLLDLFCDFLLQATSTFRGSGSLTPVRFRDVEADALDRMKNKAPRIHIAKPVETLADEVEPAEIE
jgi:hypothetical protein